MTDQTALAIGENLERAPSHSDRDMPPYVANHDELAQLSDGSPFLLIAEPVSVVRHEGRIALKMQMPHSPNSRKMADASVWIDCQHEDPEAVIGRLTEFAGTPIKVRSFSGAFYANSSEFHIPS